MTVQNTHTTAMARQIEESVTIEIFKNENDITLNSKSEWRNARVPRVKIEIGDRDSAETQPDITLRPKPLQALINSVKNTTPETDFWDREMSKAIMGKRKNAESNNKSSREATETNTV